ncbi:MAG: hypothetical protein EXR73_06720 [Myxococcales bacterium]|nr:hypothetical protein [Myxococcales bacterium]
MRVAGALLFVFVFAVACGPNLDPPPVGDGDGGGAGCGGGCPEGKVCVPELGCRDCFPGRTTCAGASGNEVWECGPNGTSGEHVMDCAAEEQCVNGFCLTACQAAEANPSTVGCHFWAVDLDNSVDNFMGFMSDAAAAQFAVAVANVSDYGVSVSIYKNVAPYGQPPSRMLVVEATIGPNDLVELNLPQREVDGTMGQNAAYAPGTGSGTFVSSHAYEIESTGPVVAYQFNPIVQQFSNDASLLVPRQALGEHYFAMGWPTSNPCGAPPGDPLHFEGVPDHTYVTIIGQEEGTHVTVIPTHPVKASSGPSGLVIPATPRGVPIEFDLGPFDVVNLESDQPEVSIFMCLMFADRDGDFTGTQIHATKPVAVFTGNERGNGTGGAEPPPPPGWDGTTCCTDHLEEQMFPTESLGWNYAVSRSPVRSGEPGYEEPDLYRVLATIDGTTVTTSLAGADHQFALNAGEFRTFHAYAGFTVESSGGAIMLGQVLVSQGLVPGGIGDPSFTVFPAVDQFRDHYVFLVPTTFQDNYLVAALPIGTSVDLDNSGEFPPACSRRGIGTLAGVTYEQVTCRLTPGVHRLATSAPAGLTVYGYYSVGSYAYCGGSDVDVINPIL